MVQTVSEWEAFFDGFKGNLAPFVHDGGASMTVIQEHPDVHPEQTAWARQMRKGIYMPVDGRVSSRSVISCAAPRWWSATTG